MSFNNADDAYYQKDVFGEIEIILPFHFIICRIFGFISISCFGLWLSLTFEMLKNPLNTCTLVTVVFLRKRKTHRNPNLRNKVAQLMILYPLIMMFWNLYPSYILKLIRVYDRSMMPAHVQYYTENINQTAFFHKYYMGC